MKIRHKKRDRFIDIKIEKNKNDDELYEGNVYIIRLGVNIKDGFFSIERLYDERGRLSIDFCSPNYINYQQCWVSGGMCLSKIKCFDYAHAVNTAYKLVTDWAKYHDKIYENETKD